MAGAQPLAVLRRDPALAAGHVLDASTSADATSAPRSLAVLPQSVSPRRKRWSADAWALVRRGQSAPALAAGAASYGGSQFGMVVRYDLATASLLRPQFYLRATGALGGAQVGTSGARARDHEGAFGLIARPVPRLPLAVMAEVRVQAGTGPARVRPVIAAVSEIPPLRLALGAEGEFYAQAGWAGGRDATAFFDAALAVQRRVVEPVSGLELRAGGGVWSGGQRGAARLDAGPRIELRCRLGAVNARLDADWRFRVAGDAEPGSGPALTLSAGF